MVAYSFKERFIPKIRAGIKSQTIRGVHSRHVRRPGQEVQLYYSMRTVHCRLIGRAVCRDVRPIVLDFDSLRVEIAGETPFTTRPARDLFAVADGFETWTDLVQFWRCDRSERTRRNGAALGRFVGELITWHSFVDCWEREAA